MKQAITAFHTLAALLLLACGSPRPNYQSMVSGRADRDTTFTINGVQLGKPISDYTQEKSYHVVLKKEQKTYTYTDPSSKEQITVLANVEYWAEPNDSGLVRLFGCDLSTGNESMTYLLPAVVEDISNKIGVFSWYEFSDKSSFGERKDTLTLSEKVDVSAVLTRASQDLKSLAASNGGGNISYLNFTWMWKNESLSLHLNSYDKAEVLHLTVGAN